MERKTVSSVERSFIETGSFGFESPEERLSQTFHGTSSFDSADEEELARPIQDDR